MIVKTDGTFGSSNILPLTFLYENVQEWTDANMRWNTSEYSDIKDIRLPPARLWKPDILMYNRSVLSTSPDMQAIFDNFRYTVQYLGKTAIL